jgi:hypothetical protein
MLRKKQIPPAKGACGMTIWAFFRKALSAEVPKLQSPPSYNFAGVNTFHS